MAAIYYYIHEKVCEWYSDNAQDIFDEWIEKLGEARQSGDDAGVADAEAGRPPGATLNPFGADTATAFHEAWAEGYENGFEATTN